jgi:DNA-binding transcriptional MerR regulator
VKTKHGKHGMKIGELSAALGVSRDTITFWLKRPELERFFSPDALGRSGAAQRQFLESDVLALNSIRHLRYVETITEWVDIAQRLDSGWRAQDFSQSAIAADSRTIPLPQAEQSARAAATMAERDAALRRVSELESELTRLRGELESEREKRLTDREKHAGDMERLLREISDLRYQIGRLESKNEGQG